MQTDSELGTSNLSRVTVRYSVDMSSEPPNMQGKYRVEGASGGSCTSIHLPAILEATACQDWGSKS